MNVSLLFIYLFIYMFKKKHPQLMIITVTYNKPTFNRCGYGKEDKSNLVSIKASTNTNAIEITSG